MPCLEDQLTNEAGFVNLFALPEDLVHNQTLFGCFAGQEADPKKWLGTFNGALSTKLSPHIGFIIAHFNSWVQALFGHLDEKLLETIRATG